MTLRRIISTAVPYGTVLLALACAIGGLRFQRTRLRDEAFVRWRRRMNTSADATRAAVQTWLDERQLDDRLLSRQAAKTPGLFGLQAPGMDGWELLKRLTADPELADIPVVIVSSIAGEMQHSFVGAVDWVDKPVAHEMLRNAIGRNIAHKERGAIV